MNADTLKLASKRSRYVMGMREWHEVDMVSDDTLYRYDTIINGKHHMYQFPRCTYDNSKSIAQNSDIIAKKAYEYFSAIERKLNEEKSLFQEGDGHVCAACS